MLRFSIHEPAELAPTGPAHPTSFINKMRLILKRGNADMLRAALLNPNNQELLIRYGFLLADYCMSTDIHQDRKDTFLANELVRHSSDLAQDDKAKICVELREIYAFCREECPISIPTHEDMAAQSTVPSMYPKLHPSGTRSA